MADPFTPTESNVLHRYIESAMRAGLGLNVDDAEGEYERFLARVKSDAAREALDGLADDALADGKEELKRGNVTSFNVALIVAEQAQSRARTHYPEQEA